MEWWWRLADQARSSFFPPLRVVCLLRWTWNKFQKVDPLHFIEEIRVPAIFKLKWTLSPGEYQYYSVNTAGAKARNTMESTSIAWIVLQAIRSWEDEEGTHYVIWLRRNLGVYIRRNRKPLVFYHPKLAMNITRPASATSILSSPYQPAPISSLKSHRQRVRSYLPARKYFGEGEGISTFSCWEISCSHLHIRCFWRHP